MQGLGSPMYTKLIMRIKSNAINLDSLHLLYNKRRITKPLLNLPNESPTVWKRRLSRSKGPENEILLYLLGRKKKVGIQSCLILFLTYKEFSFKNIRLKRKEEYLIWYYYLYTSNKYDVYFKNLLYYFYRVRDNALLIKLARISKISIFMHILNTRIILTNNSKVVGEALIFKSKREVIKLYKGLDNPTLAMEYNFKASCIVFSILRSKKYIDRNIALLRLLDIEDIHYRRMWGRLLFYLREYELFCSVVEPLEDFKNLVQAIRRKDKILIRKELKGEYLKREEDLLFYVSQ